MATEAARLNRKKSLVRKRKTDLPLTGLLMEGLGRQKPRASCLRVPDHTLHSHCLHIDFSVRLRVGLPKGHFPSSRWKGRISPHSHR